MDYKKINFIIVNLIILLFIGGCSNSLTAEQKFLKNNYEEINLDKPLDVKLLKEDLVDKEVFLTGEYHRIYPNKKIELQLIKYLRENANINYLLAELSCGDSVIINKYLQSGDESILKSFFDEPSKTGALGFTTDTYEFYKELYKYNSSLSNNEKLKVIGVDLEFSISNTLRALKVLLSENSDIKELNLVLDKISKLENSLNTSNNVAKQAYELSMEIFQDIKKNNSLYKEYLGNNYADFEIVAENFKYSMETINGKNGDVNKARDINMYNNFCKYYKILPKGKYFGQFGMDHTFRQSTDDIKRFGTFLNRNDDSPVKEKVLTIAFMYDSEEVFSNSQTCSQEFLDTINPFIKSQITLFKLTGENSPFESNFNKDFFPLPTIKSIENSNNTFNSITEFYQYIMVIKDSKETYQWRN